MGNSCSETAAVGFDLEPLLVPSPTAATLLSISERRLADLVKDKTVPHVRIGHRLLFPLDALREWVAARTCGQGANVEHPVTRVPSGCKASAGGRCNSGVAGQEARPQAAATDH